MKVNNLIWYTVLPVKYTINLRSWIMQYRCQVEHRRYFIDYKHQVDNEFRLARCEGLELLCHFGVLYK